MKVIINGETEEIDLENPSLKELLDSLDIESSFGTAVAVNETVVAKSKWGEHRVEPDDDIEIIRATQGG
jgi:sulfur carrier protein